ncbi:unnamed protein product [Neospora caninum Liverpool]|uniref:50S ribosomal protein L35 n=1 Tax=Neospora caninum (strain Liverpool) TaxID=572307 RepID=F0VCJ1_NEOCL|nr:uncharacterized protein NCLIV_014740 [Neospora caninum Liverpool]CBZ51680.1 unnamed protein product [Neospora caninum Liverpool]CEL65634.1 TPA: ribosomal protein RPL35 [Neospora caninum Liverpool]|eukprot:XP_003881713.1 uncharacterized protein NCLIV_014740 [Neospora caninum Liverpool]
MTLAKPVHLHLFPCLCLSLLLLQHANALPRSSVSSSPFFARRPSLRVWEELDGSAPLRGWPSPRTGFSASLSPVVFPPTSLLHTLSHRPTPSSLLSPRLSSLAFSSSLPLSCRGLRPETAVPRQGGRSFSAVALTRAATFAPPGTPSVSRLAAHLWTLCSLSASSLPGFVRPWFPAASPQASTVSRDARGRCGASLLSAAPSSPASLPLRVSECLISRGIFPPPSLPEASSRPVRVLAETSFSALGDLGFVMAGPEDARDGDSAPPFSSASLRASTRPSARREASSGVFSTRWGDSFSCTDAGHPGDRPLDCFSEGDESGEAPLSLRSRFSGGDTWLAGARGLGSLQMKVKVPTPALKPRTRKSIAKRFKITATGKLLYRHSGRQHLMSSKSGRRKRRLRKVCVLTGAMARKYLACIHTPRARVKRRKKLSPPVYKM